jgi:hypothetical protein
LGDGVFQHVQRTGVIAVAAGPLLIGWDFKPETVIGDGEFGRAGGEKQPAAVSVTTTPRCLMAGSLPMGLMAR